MKLKRLKLHQNLQQVGDQKSNIIAVVVVVVVAVVQKNVCSIKMIGKTLP
jgi:hypothetical protein